MYMIRTNRGLGGSPPSTYASHVFRHVASPFTNLPIHSMNDPIRKQSSFNVTQWFGKQFPNDCLQYPELEIYCDSLRIIPHQCPVNYNLSVHLPIEKFLSSSFPSHNHSLVVEAASECFSNNPPTEILTTLVKKDIPPYKFIQNLKSRYGQAILDRRTSIRDPIYDRSFLPFWVLTLWERLSELNVAREEWTLAHRWLQQSSKKMGPTALATARKHFTCTGWSSDITFGKEHATTLTLPQLLADGCLNGTVLDLMVECVQTEVMANGHTGVYICGTIFPNEVTKLWERRAQPPEWFRERFIDAVRDHQWQTLYFPMFWPKNKHWVSIRINFSTGVISMGQ